MGNSIKRFLALMLALVMVIGMMPTNVAFAEETEACEHGIVGECDQCNEAEQTPPSEDEEEPAPSEDEEESAPSEEEEDPDAGLDAAAEGGEETPAEGYKLTIYNADGTVGMEIDGTKSISDFCLKSAIEDARVFVNNAFLYGITTPATYVVEMYEDSHEGESFEIGSDVTINGNGYKIVCAEGVEVTNNGTLNDATIEMPTPSEPEKTYVAQIGDQSFETMQAAIDAAKAGDTITLLRDVTLTETLTLPAGITLNGNSKFIDGEVWAAGNLTFVGYTKVKIFNAGYNKPIITIGAGACLEQTGGRMVIGHGATFNITGTITDAKNADKAAQTPSLIAPGASFTGAGLNFNVINAYLKFTSDCTSKNNNANGTFNFNVTNSIWDQAKGKLAFSVPDGKDPTVNFNLKDSVLTTASHLTFAVSKGEIVIDNSDVNVGSYKQLENRSTLTIKNGSVVYASVQTSQNAQNPGTVIVENATYLTTGEFSGVDLGIGKLILKNGANATVPKFGNAEVRMEPGATLTCPVADLDIVTDEANEAVYENGVYTVKSYVAEANGTKYETLAEAIAVGGEVKLLSDLVIDSETYTIADGKSVTLDMNGKKLTVTDNKTTNYELFYIYGEMTVIGNGTIELTATNDRDWNAMSAIFHNRGGVLTIENGTFTHKGGTDMAYVVDNSGNYYGNATTNVKDGTLTSSYIAIRNRMEQNSHGASGKAILNVSGGTISGTSRAIWAQAASTSETAPATGEINVSGGNIGLIDTPRSTGAVSMTTITGGNVAAFKGEVGELTVKGGTVGEVTMLSASGEVVNAAPNEDGVYVEKALVRVYAKDNANSKTFSNFKAAIEFAVAQKGNVPVYLLDNVTVNETIVINDTNAGLVELQGDKTGGQTFTLTSTHSGELFRVEKGTLSVKNLKVNAQGDAFYVTGGIVNLNYHSKGKQFIEVTSQTGNCVYVRGGSVNVNGAKLTSLGEFPAIQGNGNYVGNVTLTKWNIGDGTYPVVSAPNTDIAIYWPGNGKLTIEGGEYTGDTAVYAKSGNIVISGGTFIGTGDAKAYEPYGNGAHATGDAVVIETSTDAAYETPVVSITGGHFASTYAQPIAVYGAGTAVNKFVSGGTFNKGLDNKIVAEDKATEKAEDGNWVIVNGVVYTEMNGEKLYYASLEEAIKAVPKNTSATITLLTNITTTGPMVGHQYVQDITIDLNGYTMSNNGIVLTAYRSGTTLTVKNGTLLGNASTGTLRATYGGRIVLGDNLTVKGMGGSAVLIYLDNGVLDITAKDGVKFEGGKQDLKKTDNANNKLNAVTVGRTGFGTLADAFAAAQDGDTILVHGDLAMDAMIVNTKKVTLDLNGCTITGTDNTSKNFSLIDNRSELTITGNGKMTLTATVNSGWNRYSAVIANNPGGKLVVENGTIEHLGGTDMAYGIDNLTNGKGTYAETVINGGTIKSTYRGIRQFLNGVEARNILTINGGTIEGANKSVWMQDPSKNPNTGSLTVGENANLVGDVYLFVTAGSTTWPVEVSIAVAALVEGSEVLTGNVPAGYKLEETNGIIGVVKFNPVAEVNGVAYETLQAAVEAAQTGETVTVLADLVLDTAKTVTNSGGYATLFNVAGKAITIDLNGKSVTVNASADQLTGAKSNMLMAVFAVDTNGTLTLTGNGSVTANAVDASMTSDDSHLYSLLIAYGADSKLVVENGTYSANSVSSALIYSQYDDIVTIKGGIYTLGNVGTDANGSPWIFNAKGQNTQSIIVKGGTFNADILHMYYPFEVNAPKEMALKDNGNGTWTMVKAVAYVDEQHKSGNWYTNEVGYATLEEAIAAAGEYNQNGAYTCTVTLLTDIELAETLVNTETVILDLNGKTLSYTSDKAGEDMITNKGDLTITDSGENGNITYTNTDTTASNVTVSTISCEPGSVLEVKGGSVVNKSDNNGAKGIYAYAIDLLTNGNLGDVTVTISGGSVISENYMAIRQFVNGESCKNILNVTGGTITGATRGINIQLKNNMAYTTISGGTVTGGDYALCFITPSENISVSGGTFNGSVWYSGTEGFISGGTYSEEPAASYLAEGYLTKKDGDWYLVEKNPAYGMVAVSGETYFETLAEALAVGGEIKLIADVELTDTVLTIEKNVTIDFNGHTVTGNFFVKTNKEAYNGSLETAVTAFVHVKKGNVVLKGNGGLTASVGEYGNLSNLIRVEADAKLTIESGNYTQNLSVIGAGMIDSRSDKNVTINGGTFVLDNVGKTSNGSPWILNTSGKNTNSIIVNGGTFNADVNHQHWAFEVEMPGKATQANGDGTWTVVDAVANVTEVVSKYNRTVGYASLEEAFAAAANNYNVTLLEGAEVTEIVIPAEFTGKLYLPTCTLTSIVNNSATAEIVINGNVVVENENGSAITGEVINISGEGTLTAIANGDHAYGIGGGETKSINIQNVHILDVKGGHVQPLFVNDTKYGKSEPEGGAAIGSGYNGAVITLTNVTIGNAQGGSKAAGIGASYHTGVTINITGCTIVNVEGGNASAGIGGSRVSNGASEQGTTINILNSTITAKGGQAGAGIGSGYDTHCQSKQPLCTINIADSTINATGGKYAAGVGTGYHNAALAGVIKSSTVNAVSGDKFYKDGYTQAQDIGFGVVDPAREGVQLATSYLRFEVADGAMQDLNGNYYISNANGLKWVADTVNNTTPYTPSIFDNATVYLTADIDLSGMEWIPIGDDRSQRTEFHGTFDGQGHTISNVTITKKTDRDDGGKSSYGLFGNLKGTVKNLTVKNVSISGAPKFIGALVGRMNDGLIENCHVVDSNVTCNNWTIGGLVGQFNNGKISGCSVTGTTVTGYAAVGAIAGIVLNSGERTIENCTVTNCTIAKNGAFGGDYDKMFGSVVGALYSGELTVNLNNCKVESTTVGGAEGQLCGYVAEGDKLYIDGTAIVAGVEDLKAALENGATDVVLAAGTYDSFPASSLKEGVTLNCEEGTFFEGNSKLNIKGATVIGATFSNPSGTAADQTINGTFVNCDFTGSNALRWCYAGDTVVFENCTISGDVYGVHFDGGATQVIFRNCTISGFNALAGSIELAVFEGCTFVGNGKSAYNGVNMWGNTEMTDCTFEFDGSTANEWLDLAGANKTATFTGCKVVTANGEITMAEAMAMDYLSKRNDNATIIIDGFELVSSGLLKKGVEYQVFNADGLATLNTMMANKTAGRDAIVNLVADIDFSGKNWTPVDSHADSAFEIAELNGNGHTISNMTINGQAMFTRFAGSGDVVIKDITFDGATVSSTGINVSILTVQTYQNLLLDNVDVKNSSITGSYKVAPLIATVYNESSSTVTATLKNCDVENVIVKATSYDFCTAGMVAFVYEGNNDKVVFENCTVTDVLLMAKPNGYASHAAVYVNDADTDDCFNEVEGVTVTNVTFKALN